MNIKPQPGLTFELDLSPESYNLAGMLVSSDTVLLPIRPDSFGRFYSGPRHFTQRSGGDNLYQLFLTHSGRGHFQTADGEFDAEPNTVCLMDFSHPHRYETMGDSWDYEWINFNGMACKHYYDLINPDGFQICPIGEDPVLPRLFSETSAMFLHQDLLGVVHVCTQIIRMLDALYTLKVEQERSRIDLSRGNIMLSVDFMNAHYAEEITLDDLAKAAYLSKYHYARQFKSYMGMSPYEYLSHIRLNHARMLLLGTSEPLEDIAWKSGFRNAKNLIRQFRAIMNTTPGEFRRNAGAWSLEDQLK